MGIQVMIPETAQTIVVYNTISDGECPSKIFPIGSPPVNLPNICIEVGKGTDVTQYQFILTDETYNNRPTWSSSTYTIKWNSVNQYWFVENWIGGTMTSSNPQTPPLSGWLIFGNTSTVTAYSGDCRPSNLRINKIKSVKILNVAISNRFGKAVFIRLLGNLTGSHIEGSKEIVYGAVDKIYVPKISLKSLLKPGKNIFVKLDIEGQEFNALQSIKDEWQFVDVIAEISSKKNAELIFNFCRKNNLIIYSEKNRWKIATELFMMPNCWNEGSVLITKKTDFFNFLAIKSKGLFKQNR
jgi:FkbM family methyltransferase